MMMKRYLVSDLGGTRVLFFFLSFFEFFGRDRRLQLWRNNTCREYSGEGRKRKETRAARERKENEYKPRRSGTLSSSKGRILTRSGTGSIRLCRSLPQQAILPVKRKHIKRCKKKRLQKFVMTDSGLARSCIITAALTARDLDKSKKIHGPLAGHWPMHTPTWEMTKKKISKTKYNKIINKTLGKKKKKDGKWSL